jgi:hypothetical protein
VLCADGPWAPTRARMYPEAVHNHRDSLTGRVDSDVSTALASSCALQCFARSSTGAPTSPLTMLEVTPNKELICM